MVLRDNTNQTSPKLRHWPSGIALHYQGLETCKGTDFCFDVIQRAISAEIGRGKALPELDGRGLVHVEGLLDESLIGKHAAEIDHADIEKRIAIAKVAEVDEITLITSKDGIRKLKVAMDGGVLIGNIVNHKVAAFQLASLQLAGTGLDIVACSVALQNLCIVAVLKQGYGEAGLLKLFNLLYGESSYNAQRAQRVFEQAQKINLIQ